MTEMLVLPWARPSSKVANKAFWDLYQKGYFDEEYSDVKILYLQPGGSFSLFTTKPVNSLADLRGLKIRFSGAPQANLINALGATPVNIPSGEQYAALEKGIVDGVITSLAAVKAFKLQEVAKYIVEPPFTGAQLFAAIMNKDTYNQLHKDGRAFIGETGEKYTMLAAAADDGQCLDGYNALLKAGAKACKLSSADLAEMDKLCASLWTKWIADMKAKGFSDAKNALDDYYNLMKGLGVERPAVGYAP
jgi:TRAP-type C4-dicarboxylate transport system substrate-binding protein